DGCTARDARLSPLRMAIRGAGRKEQAMKRAVVILFALAVGAHESRAGGSGGIEGTVVDQDTRNVAAHLAIAVTCGSVHKYAVTDGSGHFSIAGLPEGACTLIASGGAYAASSVAVTVAAGSIS